MKTLFTIKMRGLLAGFLILTGTCFGQLSSKDIFENHELVWYGLDFSQAKFVGKFDQGFGRNPVNEFEIINKYIPAWNSLVVVEPRNFDLENTFWKKTVYYDLKPVEALNAKIKPEDVYTYNSYTLDKGKLEPLIQSYADGDKKEGLGLVFVVESFNKPMLEASYWIIFFDIRTKKILLSERCAGKPSGFGLRNYWAGSLKRVLNDIRFYKFKAWKKMLSKEIVSN
jgi:hypothetical protein